MLEALDGVNRSSATTRRHHPQRRHCRNRAPRLSLRRRPIARIAEERHPPRAGGDRLVAADGHSRSQAPARSPAALGAGLRSSLVLAGGVATAVCWRSAPASLDETRDGLLRAQPLRRRLRRGDARAPRLSRPIARIPGVAAVEARVAGYAVDLPSMALRTVTARSYRCRPMASRAEPADPARRSDAGPGAPGGGGGQRALRSGARSRPGDRFGVLTIGGQQRSPSPASPLARVHLYDRPRAIAPTTGASALSGWSVLEVGDGPWHDKSVQRSCHPAWSGHIHRRRNRNARTGFWHPTAASIFMIAPGQYSHALRLEPAGRTGRHWCRCPCHLFRCCRPATSRIDVADRRVAEGADRYHQGVGISMAARSAGITSNSHSCLPAPQPCSGFP